MDIEVTRTYLQLAHHEDLNPARVDDSRIHVERLAECPASFYRYLYSEVGRFYHWTDRLPWTDDEIRSHLARPEIAFWVMYGEGSPAGYFELERHADGSIEVAYFGLLQEFLGRGLGKHLLTVAVEQAWSDGANRVGCTPAPSTMRLRCPIIVNAVLRLSNRKPTPLLFRPKKNAKAGGAKPVVSTPRYSRGRNERVDLNHDD
jgi:GNAT superfamily N-acetyltransferase